MDKMDMNGFAVEVVTRRGNKTPYKGTRNWYQLKTNQDVEPAELMQRWSEHVGIPLSANATFYGQRIVSCTRAEKKGEYILETFEPYTD